MSEHAPFYRAPHAGGGLGAEIARAADTEGAAEGDGVGAVGGAVEDAGDDGDFVAKDGIALEADEALEKLLPGRGSRPRTPTFTFSTLGLKSGSVWLPPQVGSSVK